MEEADAERETYDALCAYTLTHPDPAFIHQYVVDAFAAQRATSDTRPITLTFALVGLYLAVERGCTGKHVQRVHTLLARHRREWPRFALPAERGSIRVADVMGAEPGPERDAAVRRWCASVWAAYAESRVAVIALLETLLP